MRVVPLADRGLFAITSKWSPALRNACHHVPGMRWVDPCFTANGQPIKAWCGYADAVFLVSEKLKAQGIRLDGLECLPQPGKYRIPYVNVAWSQLREYQKIGVRFLLDRGRTGAILADDMGGGKTNQATTAARALKEKTLVVCAPEGRSVWARWGEGDDPKGELQKWWPKAGIICTPEGTRPFTPIRIKKPPKQKAKKTSTPLEKRTGWQLELFGEDTSLLEKLEMAYEEARRGYTVELRQDGALRHPSVIEEAQIVVIHYDILWAWVDVLLTWNFRTLILDEAHLALIKATSRRSQAVRACRDHAAAVFALTGTPPAEKPTDLWNLVDTISPGRFGAYFNYGLRYAGGHQEEVVKDKTVWKFDGKTNLEELNARCKYFVLRRSTADMGIELPELTRQIVDIDVPQKNRRHITLAIVSSKKAMREALNLAATGKLKPGIELVASDAQTSKHVVVFVWRRRIAKYVTAQLNARGIPASFIHGGVLPRKRRQDTIDAARRSPQHVLVCTIATCSTSIDLSFARVAVFLELSWKADQLAQCEKRLHRFPQVNPVFIRYVIARGTGDELVKHAVVCKLKDSFEKIFGETGDNLSRDLGGAEQDGLKALALRLQEQQKREDAAWKKALRQ